MAIKKAYSGLGKRKPSSTLYAKKRKYTGIASTSSTKVRKTKSGLTKKVRPLRILPAKANAIPINLPKTDISERGLTLRQLLKTTPKFMKYNAEECAFKKWKATTSKVGGRPAIIAKVVHNNQFKVDRERPHEVTMIGLNADLKISDRKQKVMVSCECENYMFMWEYANAKHGAAKIIYGNGDAPSFTNPGEVPGMCKHATAVADRIMREKL